MAPTEEQAPTTPVEVDTPREWIASPYYRHLTDEELVGSLRAEALHGIVNGGTKDKLLLAAERMEALLALLADGPAEGHGNPSQPNGPNT